MFRDRVTVVELEYPYYDRDYLSTYYYSYSHKNREHLKECIRLHLYGMAEYYGNIVLRPIQMQTIIGTSYLSPKLLLHESAYLLTPTYRMAILGDEVRVRAFPWMTHDTEIAGDSLVSTG